MSDTIDFGIDLGTTNSVIAVAENDTVTVLKNNDGWDITPSAVWIPKPGQIKVGRPARDRAFRDPQNAAVEFKLEMGLADARRNFANAGLELTPQQLSAEVLKSLRADAAHHCGTAPDAAVITVPAAFTLNQNKATTDAALLAGLTTAPLVQEPTAAAFAYGFHDADDRAYWMVFDFGGGTFDAAVVSKHDGELRVLNHAGDPYLGGKLIDWAVAERILGPQAAGQLDLRDFRRESPRWGRNFAMLKNAAEEAKIQLSRLERVEFMVDLRDENGDTQTVDLVLTRDELDAVAEPFYARAINFCRAALKDASLSPADIDRLVLVGGQTLAPGLRERLADPQHGLGIELDTSLDPTTVVARGAAIFASTLRRPHTVPANAGADEFVLELAYEPSATTTTPTVAGRVSGPATDWKGYSVVLDNPEGRPPFNSGRVLLNASGAFATDVAIDKGRTSKFTVELIDDKGTPQPITPNTLSIRHREVEFGGVRLAHSLGIQLADGSFAPMIRKGATLPVTEREVYTTSIALGRSDPDAAVLIPVLQGERDRGDRNRKVGMLEIRPKDLRIDLPAGSEVEVTFEVDSSSLVTVVADVPLVQTQFEAMINLADVTTPAPEQLEEMLSEVEQRLTSLRRSVSAGGSPAAERLLDKIEEEGTIVTGREQVQAAKVDAGAAATAEERLRNIQADLDDVEQAVQVPALAQELEALLDEATELVKVNRLGDSGDRQALADLRRRVQDAIQAQDVAAMRAQQERLQMFLIEVERRSPDWPVKVFAFLRDVLAPTGQAGPLIREGERAIAQNDMRALEGVNQRMIRMLPKDQRDEIEFGGLNRR
ncbi:Hsp70 family protein [Nonomuraea terrae]|uniref:Hsp70 family protein n=1 Tax=Nonomuraea terrae TaxID=2530383 RepID=A0A4R4ZAE0_9ACTN|nr:Hsp70 family protein [Nonomuraea terrae]TDD54109.1 Hsp70 family protein [Nonomuraea terrae]